jgi:amino-acid N-acetyltransferase
MQRLTDLRGILRYVPQFRDRVFVIAVDGAVVEDDHFGNLLLDIALLAALNIRVALVHGAGHQIRQLAQKAGQVPSNLDGTGITDGATLQLALAAANRVSHEILEGLAATDLRAACSNAVVAHPAGILQGVDYQWTGRVERVDTVLLQTLLRHGIVPVIPPLGCDGEGHTYRLNSDAVAVEVARALDAVKLIYLTTEPGVRQGGELVRQLSVEEAETLLAAVRRQASTQARSASEGAASKDASSLTPGMVSKLEHAVRAARAPGVPRIHIIDGRVEEGLLAEVFSNEGVGTLVHANEYQAIRRARKKDARALLALLGPGMESEELLKRTRTDVERQIDDYFVFEVDGSAAACAALHFYPEEGKAELASVCVHPSYENQGIGAKLVQYAEAQARAAGARVLFCLSTQAFNYFVHKAGFSLGGPDDLPPARRERYERSGRKSYVLLKTLTGSRS